MLGRTLRHLLPYLKESWKDLMKTAGLNVNTFHGTPTRYIHGTPVHRPGYHHRRILFWIRYGEERGLRALLQHTSPAATT